ncbi:MAG: enoyl-CoA hydratase/carnithine racemase [Rhodospirillales bacterium]|nr:enoyl-CoA hydratase/carnithine racemase [Rhodospirillales bacterium]
MAADETPVLMSVAQGVATVTLNRPAVLNALNNALAQALLDALNAASSDDAVRVIVITGAGDAFMAGGDVGYFHRKLAEFPDRAQFRPVIVEMIERAQNLARTIRDIPKPIIASVHGGCAGFGLSLMLACDLAIAADNAKFTLAYIHLATTPDGGASFHLPRMVGQKRAAEIALLGDRFSAAEAERWGLINRVVPLAELEATIAKLAGRMAKGPALAYARTKKLLNAADGNSFDAQLAAETESFASSALTEDFAAGVAGFVEKKSANFTGR